MGGLDGEMFQTFKLRLFFGFLALRRYVDHFIFLLKIVMEDSDLPCFKLFDIEKFRSRFQEH